jgi:hypothetical protein
MTEMTAVSDYILLEKIFLNVLGRIFKASDADYL